MDIRERYRSELASFMGMEPFQIGLFWKGRVGLYAILKALGVGKGDEVIVPAFTCVVVPNAILYLGAKPIYVDVNPATFNLETGLLEGAITSRTRAVMAQNTFGLPADLDPVMEVAQRYQIPVIEDCTHGFGGKYNGRLNGTVAHAAFFSTQWNKPFSTGWGGFTAIRDEELARRVRAWEDQLPRPAPKQERMLGLQLFARKRLLHSRVYWPVLRLYRRLSHLGLIAGSSEGSELTGTMMPLHYLMAGGAVQAREGLRQLKRWSAIAARRAELGALYDRKLKDLGFSGLHIPPKVEHGFLKYPLLVQDRDAFFALAEQRRIRLGDWMLSPIHPVPDNWEQWGYVPGSCPVGERLSRHVVNLLTDMDLTDAEIRRTIDFLEEQKAQLLG